MDFTNPALNAARPDPDVVPGRAGHGQERTLARAALPDEMGTVEVRAGKEHVTFGAVSVDLVGVEEVAA